MITVYVVAVQTILREGLVQTLARQKDIRVVGQSDAGLGALSIIMEANPSVAVISLLSNCYTGIELTKKLLRSDKAPR